MSEGFRNVQQRCGCNPDGQFGPNSAKGIMKHYEMSPERAAHFLGQVCIESMNFQAVEENLNYSVDALMKVFGRYFKTPADAKPYSKNPRALANYVYMDKNRSEKSKLGNVNTDDGWIFRGRGFLQITGRANTRKFASDMRLPDVMDEPQLIASHYPMESALWYFNKRRGLWKICDEGVSKDTCKRVTKSVNGGYNHLDERTDQTFKIYEWLK
jgi:putative chitinase